MNTNSVRSGFALNLGLVSLPVDLYSVIPSKKKGDTRTLCKEHMQPINQVYICPVDAKQKPETVKGVEQGKGKYILPREEDSESSIERDEGVNLVAVPTDELRKATVTTDKLYYLTPHKSESVETWEVLFRLAQDKKRTLIGQAALRKNSRKIYQLIVFSDYLTLQEIEFPEHIREAPEIEHPKVSKALMGLAKQVLTAKTIDWAEFDADDEGLRRFRDRIEGGKTIVIDTATGASTDNVVDLMAALKASVEAEGST